MAPNVSFLAPYSMGSDPESVTVIPSIVPTSHSEVRTPNHGTSQLSIPRSPWKRVRADVTPALDVATMKLKLKS